MLDRRTMLKMIGVASSAAALPALAESTAPAKPKKPNILVIVTDDQGYADLSAYAHHAKDIKTPHMDRIAKGGVALMNGYVSAPVCSPSRAGWNTGRYQQRWDPAASWGPGLPVNVPTVAQYLKKAGYVCGKVGKSDYGKGYHSTTSHENPMNHGYDEFLGFSSHAHDFFVLDEETEKKAPDPRGKSAAMGRLLKNKGWASFKDGYTTNIFTDFAIDFLKRHKDGEKPMYLTLSYSAVHHLIHEVPDKYLKKHGVKKIPNYDPAKNGRYGAYYNKYNQLGAINDKDMRGYYLANLNCLDDNIGRLLDAMTKMGLDENTLVIFFADNGGSPLTGACNRPLRGSKYVMFEGGLRVPMMMRFPGTFKPGTVCKEIVSTLDVLPTCLSVAGIKAPEDAILDGHNMLDVVAGKAKSPWAEKPMFWKFGGDRAVRMGDWKLVRGKNSNGRTATSQILSGPHTKGEWMLFNIKDDQAEQNNIASAHPDVVARLSDLWKGWDMNVCARRKSGPAKPKKEKVKKKDKKKNKQAPATH
ncbi:MAG: sulfatase-like hydrolase/transferase [Phycisphaerales bacterium]|jgi:arylsulfatase A-like enzyme|nr:sulfatase-like hydrolase/transferase [Phycisphaerales bacterium]MBT7170485.1 sulfatase-like hydrolase/transferase [Phycisphaerales bacterium]